MPRHPAAQDGFLQRYRLAAVAILVLLIVGAAAWAWQRGAPEGAAANIPVLKVGDQRGGAQALLRAAGELDDVPYPIEWALFPAAHPLLEALGAGAIDIGGIGGAPFAFAYSGGSKIKAVHAYRPLSLQGSRASAIIVRKDSPLRSVADLRGKTIATIRGSAGQDLALRLLEAEGLTAKDVRWVYLANGEAKAALESGAIHAWSTWGSYVGIALLENGDRMLADATGFKSGVGFYAATDAAIAGKRAQLDDYLRRLARARAWAQAHREEYARVLAEETGLPLKVALFTVEASAGGAVPIDAEVIAEQAAIFERYRRAGIIPAVPDIRNGYDASFNGAVTAAAS